MGSNNVSKITAATLLLSLFILLILALNNYGKSADDLYTKGKTLILDEESFHKGVELFLLFEKKFPKDPRIPEIMLALSTSYQARKNFSEAEKYFQILIDKYPDSSEAYKGMFLLGYMYYDVMKDTEKALNIFRKFITMYPDSELTLSAMVIIENIEIPLEEWSIVRNLNLSSEK